MTEQYPVGTLVIAQINTGPILATVLASLEDGLYSIRGTFGREIIDFAGKGTGKIAYMKYIAHNADLHSIPANQCHLNHGMLRDLYGLKKG